MTALMSPKWVYKIKGSMPLIYYFFIPNNKDPFKVYLTKTPNSTMRLELSDAKQFPNGIFQLSGNKLIFIFPWELNSDVLSGFYEYELVTEDSTQSVKLAVIDFTYKEILTNTKLRSVPKDGLGWVRARTPNKSWATDEFMSVIITAIEKTYLQTECNPIEFWDWSGPNGTDVNTQYNSPQHPPASHKNGIAVDIKYVFKEPGKVDWEWFILLMRNVSFLTDRSFRFIINDVWYQKEFWPMLTSRERQELFPHISSEAGHGGHKDHTHFNFNY